MATPELLLLELRALRDEVALLRTELRRDKIYDVWVDESDAAAQLNLTARNLRRRVKDGKLDIKYRNTNGRKWQYSRASLKTFLTQSSNQI